MKRLRDVGTAENREIVKHFLEPKMNGKMKFVYNNNSESQRIMGDMFDLDKLKSRRKKHSRPGHQEVCRENEKTRSDEGSLDTSQWQHLFTLILNEFLFRAKSTLTPLSVVN
ncbi:hypothetical protein GQ55_3G339400 [Panicum hallii var. hallii]|uniref:Uncharacterized protein n=1 Tax=Panicum hallii var. hallii TaxID=1504633 RepID=A0A2T7EFN3_9POAL|nr:hypothetical protein GQ55_3G339400 [Panicum hallii var. hallii]